MKRTLCIILALVMLVLTACTPAAPADTTAAATTAATTEALVDQGIKNIVLIIGDGMGVDQVKAGELAASKKFAFTGWQHTLVDTNSLNGKGEPLNTTDSAASATALATGTLTTNGRIGMDTEGTLLKTIMDYASQDYGKATGVITTDYIYGATPSGFSAHASSRNSYDEILSSQLQSGVDLFCAKYAAEVLDRRGDVKNAGYTLSYSMHDAKNAMDAEKVFWLLNVANYNASDKLADVTSLALDYLSQDPDGFVLMIEQANIDGYGHKNEFNGLPQCVNILNDTVDAVLEWIGDRSDTAILITADHETGGLEVSTESDFKLSYECENGDLIYYNFNTLTHTNSKVDLFVYGFEPDFTRFYTEDRPDAIKNTNIFEIMLGLLEDPLQENN